MVKKGTWQPVGSSESLRGGVTVYRLEIGVWPQSAD